MFKKPHTSAKQTRCAPHLNRRCCPSAAPWQHCSVASAVGLQGHRSSSAKEAAVLRKPIEGFWEIVPKQCKHSRCQLKSTWHKQNTDFKLQSVSRCLAHALLKDFVRILKSRNVITKSLVREERSCKAYFTFLVV